MVQFTTVLATLAPILTLTAGLALPDPRNITSASFADLDKRADTGVYMCQNQNWKGPCFWQDNPGQNTCVMLNKPWAQNIWSFGPDRGWKQCTVYMYVFPYDFLQHPCCYVGIRC